MGKILIDVCDKQGKKERMDLEDVLYYELLKLNLNNCHDEVLKAFAVLKRSFLAGYIKNSKYYVNRNEELLIADDFKSNEENDALKRAVNDTRGIIAVCNDKAVDLYFTKCCGGGTCNSEDVLGYRLNYLRKVLCHFCSQRYSEKVINVSDAANKINKIPYFKEETGNTIKDVIRDETGRIISANILGKKVNAEEFINIFEIESSRAYFMEHSILIKAIGSGLGLGICLEGAENMSMQGKNYMDIINYYYTGVKFEKLDENDISAYLTGRRIVIDPGHGGTDKGNECSGIFEKDVNLSIAKYLKDMLEKIKASVILTRDCDKEVSLLERVRIINNFRPDFHISIHQNSFNSKGVNGVEVYCYSNDECARKLAEIICSNISRNLGLIKRGVRIGDYYLLRESKVSGIIVECMYMSGEQDSRKYKDENYLTIAKSIYESICSYYGVEP